MNDFSPKDDKDSQTTAAIGVIDMKRPLRFVLIQRMKVNPDFPWEVVGEDCFSDIVNQVTSELTFKDKDTMKCFAWADARKGQIALKPASRTRIESFRQAIREWSPDDDDDDDDAASWRDLTFETYLLDALVQKYSLTILLKRNHKKICLLYTSPSPRD